MSDIISAAMEQAWETSETWIDAILHPVEMVNKLLAAQDAGTPQLELRRVWVSTFVASMLIRLPFLHFAGVTLNAEFYAVDAFLYVGTQLTNVVLIYLLLKVFIRTSSFQNTLAIYTVQLVYTPFTTLIAAPGLYDLLRDLHLSRLANASPRDAFLHWYEAAKQVHQTPADTWQYFVSSGQSFFAVVTMIATAVLAECLSQRYGSNRWRTYLAVAVAGVLGLPFSLGVWTPLQWFTFYSYMP